MPDLLPGSFDRRHHRWAADNVAARLVAGPWTAAAIAMGLNDVVGPDHPHTRAALIRRLTRWRDGTYPPASFEVFRFLCSSPYFRPSPRRAVRAVLDPPRFAPIHRFEALSTPALTTPRDLAEWLRLSEGQLDWLSDEIRGHGRADATPLQHYQYAFIPKHDGRPRLLEAPKPRLKAIQRRILREILDAVPVHPCAHGFVAGRSCLTGAQGHASEAVVATFDLRQFFPSIGAPRVHGVFRSLGYPWAVARRLTGLCTTITPHAVILRLPPEERPDPTFHEVPHLAQGAPTSPALANLLAWRLDARLHGLARAADARYTRYADDLAFSGDARFARGLDRFAKSVEMIVREEGFALNATKARVMPRSARQRVTGVVVNAHCNVARAEFDALKATLHNCARTGPAGQNRAAVPDFRRHLDGRIVWVEQVNPQRGAKLRRLFDRIDWIDAFSTGG